MTETHQIDYTGAMVTWVVPLHRAGTLTVRLRGGNGGTARTSPVFSGGAGGRIKGTLNVTSGTTLYVIAGGAGGPGDTGETGYGEPGGPLLGGQGGAGFVHIVGTPPLVHGAGGGAASEIRTSSDIADRIIVAGGGGGSAYKTALLPTASAGPGGMGSAAGGQSYPLSNSSFNGQGGFGGTLSAVGAGGAARTSGAGGGTWNPGDDGSAGVGGDGGVRVLDADQYSGGGGGGGYYGGGGGGPGSNVAGGGGGGSSWADTGIVSDIGTWGSSSSGDGWVEFEWEPSPSGWKVGTL